jgi:hypothetical protein
LYDALNNLNYLGIDEWGGMSGEGNYSLSMSSVIMRHESTLRVSPSILFGWDGPNRSDPKLDCVWKQMGDGRATLRKFPSNNPVFCCHYEFSKRTLADILSNTDHEAILGADTVMWSAKSGLTVFNDQM